MYTTTESIFGNNKYEDYDDYSSSYTSSTGLVVGIIIGLLVCVGKIAFWVWICYRCSRRQRAVIYESNVIVQSTTTTPAPVPTMMPGQYMPPGTQYGMPPGTQYGMPPGTQYGMPPGTQYGNPPAYYPPGSYGPHPVPVSDGAPRSVDVDPRVDVSQKNTLVENQ